MIKYTREKKNYFTLHRCVEQQIERKNNAHTPSTNGIHKAQNVTQQLGSATITFGSKIMTDWKLYGGERLK